ncbi:Serine/threonine-protein kinase/endoribonuclease ire-1 [Triticum urartu]|uniref:non-specific serine/threonine protein kinase n=1 Tax=Triticum urartu TaxID=4572 RepID=M8AW81_TRIUA|nr:Serine/threonine-protein kinase/endoribonuclease ire-1 [Triticum urartu]
MRTASASSSMGGRGKKSSSELRFYDNGTIQLVDRLSESPLWQFSTGPPLSKHITTTNSDLSYLIYPLDESDLVEVHNGTGVKLPWELEEFIARTPYIRDSVVTIGSKASTTFAVDADSGEIIYKHSLPAALNELAVPAGEAPSKLDVGRSSNIIVVVRTDYSLSASDLGVHLFNWTRSSFSANYYVKQSHPNMLEQSSCLQENIPCIRTDGVPIKLTLPDSSTANALVLQDVNKVTTRDGADALRQLQTLVIPQQTASKSGVALNGTQNQTVDGALVHLVPADPQANRFTNNAYGLLFPVLTLLVVLAWLIGKLRVHKKEIGKGSNGTVVFEGSYDGREVAVKRLLRSHTDIAQKEIQNLIASDRDPNIVRLYGCDQDDNFVYISLERCRCSLADLIQQHTDPSFSDVEKIDVELWTQDGLPSPQLLKLMRDVVAGIVHLHSLGIIHRDLKPQNVLISKEGSLGAKLSDMGISKRLQEDMSSLSHHGTGYGSSGWQAPEQLRRASQTRAMDLFSLGCLIFYCITKGKHPFGEYYERDINIINGHFDLFVVDHIPEAVHLISLLLQPKPDERPTAVYAINHPLFWSPELRLLFLRDTSDRIEKTTETDLLNALESIGHQAFGGKWREKLDDGLVADVGRYRKYNFESTRDLLRLIRNKSGHYRELPADLKVSYAAPLVAFALVYAMCMAILFAGQTVSKMLTVTYFSPFTVSVVPHGNHANAPEHNLDMPMVIMCQHCPTGCCLFLFLKKELLGSLPEGFDRYFSSRFPKLLIEVYKVMSVYCKDEEDFRKYFIGISKCSKDILQYHAECQARHGAKAFLPNYQANIMQNAKRDMALKHVLTNYQANIMQNAKRDMALKHVLLNYQLDDYCLLLARWSSWTREPGIIAPLPIFIFLLLTIAFNDVVERSRIIEGRMKVRTLLSNKSGKKLHR